MRFVADLASCSEEKRDAMKLSVTKVIADAVYVPFKKPFQTSRATNTGARNLIFRVEASCPNGLLVGVGESTPRKLVTREAAKDAENLARYLASEIQGQEVLIGGEVETAKHILGITHQMRKLATDWSGGNPFPSVTMGLEMAMLDVVSQALELPAWRLLSDKTVTEVKPNVLTFSAISPSTSQMRLDAKFVSAAQRYEFLRPKLTGRSDYDLRTLEAAFSAASRVNPNAGVWVDANERLGKDTQEFIAMVVDLMQRKKFSGKFLIEQPVPREDIDSLVRMQEIGREKTADRPFSISVMADESFNRFEDFETHPRLLSLDAFNIKAVKVGSLLESVATASRIREVNPSALIYFGGVIGATDITGWANFHQHKAAPEVELCSATPRKNFAIQLADTPISYNEGRAIVESSRHGLGTFLDLDSLEQARASFVKLSMHIARRNRRSLGSFIRAKKSLFSQNVLSKMTKGNSTATEESAEFFRKISERVNALIPVGQSQNDYEGAHLSLLDKKELDSYLIEVRVLLRGLAIRRFGALIFTVEEGGRTVAALHWSSGSSPSIAARFLTGRKHLTKIALSNAGVPVPRGERFHMADYRKALDYFATQPGPVVVKPSVGTGGVGVSTGVRSKAEFDDAWNKIKNSRKAVSRNDGHVLIEEHLPGSDYRFCIVAGRVVSVSSKVPVHVRGDGKSTVTELIERKNNARLENPHVGKRIIRVDASTAKMLKHQGLVLSSVPKENQVVLLRTANSFSQGADSVEVLDETHPTILAAAEKAAIAFPGLQQMGIDFILEDHRVSLDSQRAGICEVNSSPAISSHHFPMFGPRRDVAEEIVSNELELVGVRKARDTKVFPGIQFTITGNIDGRSLEQDLTRLCRDIEVEPLELLSRDGSITVSVLGDIEKVAVLSILLVKLPGVDCVGLQTL